MADHVVEEEPHALLNPDLPGGDASVPEDLRDGPPRIFVLLPGADIRAEADQLAGSALLELRGHPGDLAPCGQHRREHPLAAAPVHPGEVEEARARLEEDRVQMVVDHQPLGLLHPAPTLRVRDRYETCGHGAQRPDRVRHDRRLGGLGSPDGRHPGNRRGHGREPKERPPIQSELHEHPPETGVGPHRSVEPFPPVGRQWGGSCQWATRGRGHADGGRSRRWSGRWQPITSDGAHQPGNPAAPEPAPPLTAGTDEAGWMREAALTDHGWFWAAVRLRDAGRVGVANPRVSPRPSAMRTALARRIVR